MAKREIVSGVDSSDLFDPGPSSRQQKLHDLPMDVVEGVMELGELLLSKLRAVGRGSIKASNTVEYKK